MLFDCTRTFKELGKFCSTHFTTTVNTSFDETNDVDIKEWWLKKSVLQFALQNITFPDLIFLKQLCSENEYPTARCVSRAQNFILSVVMALVLLPFVSKFGKFHINDQDCNKHLRVFCGNRERLNAVKYLVKCVILDVWLGSWYASVIW